MLKVMTVVGTRPEIIRLSRVVEKLDRHCEHVLVHTGQNFDYELNEVFFEELGIAKPGHHLDIHGGGHGAMTGAMLQKLEPVLQELRPDRVLVYGDTNSTLAAALAAAKLHIPIAHVEAGLRSFNMRMPEEINRILTDRVSAQLLCPTATAVANLAAEGITHGGHEVGDVMFDAVRHFGARASRSSSVLESNGLVGEPFVLATCHRAENTENLPRSRVKSGPCFRFTRAPARSSKRPGSSSMPIA